MARHDTQAQREAVSMAAGAAMAGIGRATLYELVAAGDGPKTFKIGRRRLIRLEALREWLRELEAEQAA